jgi:hypothetical protein
MFFHTHDNRHFLAQKKANKNMAGLNAVGAIASKSLIYNLISSQVYPPAGFKKALLRWP